jgi:hypothetical protein
VNDLPKAQQPRSDDPEFWGVWVGKDDEGNAVERTTDWDRLARDWQAGQADAEGAQDGHPSQAPFCDERPRVGVAPRPQG